MKVKKYRTFGYRYDIVCATSPEGVYRYASVVKAKRGYSVYHTVANGVTGTWEQTLVGTSYATAKQATRAAQMALVDMTARFK